ncbi:hypothetical protein [Acidaminobacterium chupaoyuni]
MVFSFAGGAFGAPRSFYAKTHMGSGLKKPKRHLFITFSALSLAIAETLGYDSFGSVRADKIPFR